MILNQIEDCGYVQDMMRFEMSERFKIDVTFDVAKEGGDAHANADH